MQQKTFSYIKTNCTACIIGCTTVNQSTCTGSINDQFNYMIYQLSQQQDNIDYGHI